LLLRNESVEAYKACLDRTHAGEQARFPHFVIFKGIQVTGSHFSSCCQNNLKNNGAFYSKYLCVEEGHKGQFADKLAKKHFDTD
jgi:hypothetical protein